MVELATRLGLNVYTTPPPVSTPSVPPVAKTLLNILGPVTKLAQSFDPFGTTGAVVGTFNTLAPKLAAPSQPAGGV